MFDGNNYNCESSIKRFAKLFSTLTLVFLGLAVLAAVILLAIDTYFWWISLIVFGGALVLTIPMSLSIHLLWGFGEIVGNTQKMVSGVKAAPAEEALPEL